MAYGSISCGCLTLVNPAPQSLAATRSMLLNRRARDRAERAEYATIAVQRPQHHAASTALVKELTGGNLHRLGCLVTALGAGDDALQLHVSDRSLAWPGSPPR